MVSINNPVQSNPLRSVTAGKYVRYLTTEDISGESYYFPRSSISRNQFNMHETAERAKRDLDKTRLKGGNTSVMNFFG